MVLGYNQEDYIGYCLSDICSEVDDIVVALPTCPFSAYNPIAREEFRALDSTKEIVHRVAAESRNIRITVGEWEREETMRDHCLDLALGLACDVCLIIDADEFYPAGILAQIRRYILHNGRCGDVFWARHINCFKRFDYVVDAPKLRLPVAVIPNQKTRFVEGRVPYGPRRDLPDNLFYWHVGYVLSDVRMWEKLRTFSHAHEVVENWYEEKWLNWTPLSTNLCRRQPERWPRTKRCDRGALPTILHTHPRFRMELLRRSTGDE